MLNLKKLLVALSIILSISLKAAAADQIVITFNNTQLCAGSSISVPYTSTLPLNTIHKIQLLKNGIEVTFFEAAANPISLTIPENTVYGTDYSLIISAVGVDSAPLVITVLNPTVSQGTIYNGFSGTLTATGCENAAVIWEDANSNEVFNGNPFNTTLINEPTTYKVYCKTNTCQTSKVNYNVVLTAPVINIINYPINLCGGSSYLIDISSNLPANTGFNAYLTKTGQSDGYIGGGQIINGQLTLTAYPYAVKPGSGYSLKITYLQVETSTQNNISINHLDQITFLSQEGAILNIPKTFCADTEGKLGAVLMKYTAGLDYESVPDVTYQWQKDGNNFGNMQNPIQITEAGNYRVVASFAGCTSTSQPVSVQFGEISSVNIFPFTSHFCDGLDVKLFPDFETNTATYQWKLNGDDIPGANQRIFMANKSGKYTLEIIDKTCTLISNPKPLSFSEALPTRLIASQKTLCGESGVNISTVYYDSNPPIFENYNTALIWQKNGVDMPNITNRGIWVYEPGIYRYKLTQGTCIAYSTEHEIVNGTKWDKPVINNNYINNSFCAGNYQISWDTWGTVYKDNTIVNNYASSFNATESGIYKLVRESSNSCSSESDPIEIVVGTLSPIIKANKTELCGTLDGSYITYDSPAQFSASFSFQWFKDGTELPNNMSSGLDTNVPGTYKVRVSNGNCTEYSNEIIITRNDDRYFDLVSINSNLFDAQNLGCSNRLTSIYEEFFPNYDIKWFRNGVEIANTNYGSIMELFTPQGGTYTVIASGFGCTATSNPFVVNSDYVLQPTITQSITYMNTSASLMATGCNGTVNWYNSQTSTNSLGTGFTFATPNLNSNIPYFADCSSPTCKSAREKINVIVEPCAQMVTIKSGDWNDTTIWSCNRIPYDLESVIITTSHSVVIPTNYTAHVKEIINNGGIVVGANAIIQFKTN